MKMKILLALCFLFAATVSPKAYDISSLLLDTFMKTCGALPLHAKELDDAAGKLGFRLQNGRQAPLNGSTLGELYLWRIGNFSDSPMISFVVMGANERKHCSLLLKGASPHAGDILRAQLHLGAATEELPNEFGKTMIWDVVGTSSKQVYRWGQATGKAKTLSSLSVQYENLK